MMLIWSVEEALVALIVGALLTLFGIRAPRRHGARAFLAVSGRAWAKAFTRREAVERCRAQLGQGTHVVDVYDVPEGAQVAENGSIIYDPPDGWSWRAAQAVMSPRLIGQEEVQKQ